MDPSYEKYDADPRMPCRYGAKCYQKNPVHLRKYKHPPKKNGTRTVHIQPRKKFKVDDVRTRHGSDSDSDTDDNDSQSQPENKVNNDVSESDEETINTESLNDKNNVSDLQSENDISDKSGEAIETNISNLSDLVEQTDKKESSNIKDTVSDSESEESDDTKMLKNFISNSIVSHSDNSEKSNSEYLYESTFIKEHFLTDMPEDFYQFWNFCRTIKPSNPLEALKPIGLSLVGPFDVLAGKFKNSKPDSNILIHWRYFRDPPELQTIFRGDDKTGYHIGYFRDSPNEQPVFLVNNQANKDGVLHQMGPNIFAAMNIYLEDLKKSGDPFKKMHIGKLQSALKKEVDKFKIDLSKRSPGMVDREKKIVTRTFNKIGLVVPYDKKTELGYRALALNNKELNILFTKLQNSKTNEEKEKFLSELQPVLTYASIATDECDFGTGIELGWNIISHGVECLNFTASRYLDLNYGLLKREAFGQIAIAHMRNRKKGSNLSVL